MNVYLVGGAVRDQLMGLPVTEKDWVVVGATKEDMVKQKFKQVGRDFPVFLHPSTQEEYALARKERKVASGYYGFECDFSPDVSLEEDLARRDLTINAMAQDKEGRLIDPYQGLADLNNKVLRHVSPAFVEDPVRVLRVARFLARFHRFGFKIANETRVLMYDMVKRGELAHLVAERVWKEWEKSLTEKNPEQFIMALRACDALPVVLPEISALFGVPNPYKYHREIDSGVHSLMVLEVATKRSQDPVTRFSALVHDLGKAKTPMNKWPSHHGHEETGVPVINALCDRLKVPSDYKRLAALVSRFHLNIHRISILKATTILRILEQTDAFRRPQPFYQLLEVCQADAEGRGVSVDYQPARLWRDILERCATITAAPFIAQGLEGKSINEAMQKSRVVCIQQWLKEWKSDEKEQQ